MSELVKFLEAEQQFHHEQIARLRTIIIESLVLIDEHNDAIHAIVNQYYDQGVSDVRT